MAPKGPKDAKRGPKSPQKAVAAGDSGFLGFFKKKKTESNGNFGPEGAKRCTQTAMAEGHKNDQKPKKGLKMTNSSAALKKRAKNDLFWPKVGVETGVKFPQNLTLTPEWPPQKEVFSPFFWEKEENLPQK